MFMFRFGLTLLLVSSIGVTLRSLEYSYVMGHLVKLAFSFSLTLAFACFLGTYFRTEFVSPRNRPSK